MKAFLGLLALSVLGCQDSNSRREEGLVRDNYLIMVGVTEMVNSTLRTVEFVREKCLEATRTQPERNFCDKMASFMRKATLEHAADTERALQNILEQRRKGIE